MFKIGDIVKGIRGAPYSITNHECIGRVINKDHLGLLTIVIIEHKTRQHEVGSSFDGLEPRYFVLVKPVKPEKPKTELEIYSDFGYKVKMK